MSKAKLTIDEQIQKMKASGIMFNIFTEEQAKDFISNNTYYFKIKAFQKNYYKNGDDKYINLEFAYLKDFSTIDMRFRKLILSMVLSIEHSMKVKLNADISNDPSEDGYSIVNEFLNSKDGRYIVKALYTKTQSNYAGELIKKYCSHKFAPGSATPYHFDCPFWVLLEILSFGDFIKFYNFYYDKHAHANPLQEILFPVRCLRNAAAHNNCVLNSLKRSDHPNFTVNKEVSSDVSKIKTISASSRKNCMAVPALHDFAALLMAFLIIVESKATLVHTIEDLEDFLNRFKKHSDYYSSNSDITKTFIFFEKIVDNFKKIVYNNTDVQKP